MACCKIFQFPKKSKISHPLEEYHKAMQLALIVTFSGHKLPKSLYDEVIENYNECLKARLNTKNM